MGSETTASAEKRIGTITHFFSKINVGIILLTETLRVGDRIHTKGHTTDFTQSVASLQVEHANVPEGRPGQEVGFKAEQYVREGDRVFVER